MEKNKEKAKVLYDMYSFASQNTIISYTGPFDSQVLAVLAANIEYSLSKNPRIRKKIFKIFIELAQNISYYSLEKLDAGDGNEFGIGILIIREFDNHFTFATGNIVDSKKISPVIHKCETINLLDRDSLRQYKRKLRNLPPGIKGGGNIGLVQVALTANNPLDYKLIPLSEEQSFYIINIKIDK